MTSPEAIAARIHELCAEPPQHNCDQRGWCGATQLIAARANAEGRIWLETQSQTTAYPDMGELDEVTRRALEITNNFYTRSGIEIAPHITPRTFEIFRVEAFAQVRDNGQSFLMFRCAPFDDCIITSHIPDEVERVTTSGVPCVDAEVTAAYFEEHVIRWQSPYSSAR